MSVFEVIPVISLFLSAGMLLYHLIRQHKTPLVKVNLSSKFNKFLQKFVTSIRTPYHLPLLCADGRLHTIFAALMPTYDTVKYKREIVSTKDGGQFYIDWAEAKSNKFANGPTVLIVPGLTSTSASNYVQSMVRVITHSGFRAMVIVNRGLDGMKVLTPKVYCATHIEDIEHTMDLFNDRYPDSPIYAIGISLGSLMLGRHLHYRGKETKLSAAMLHSCPFSAAECTISLERMDNYLLFNKHLTGNLKDLYQTVSHLFSHTTIDPEAVLRSKTIKEYDINFTCKVFGYSSVDEYYAHSTLTPERLQNVAVPTLCVNADDDPFAPVSCIPEVSETENLAIVITRGGGHVGHLVGWNPFNRTYFENIIVDFLTAVYDHHP